jgi:hypothetical protein
MSRSFHTTDKEVRGLTKNQLIEQFNDLESDLALLAKKSSIKSNVLKIRKEKNQSN